MGRRLVDLISREHGMCVSAALEMPGHPDLKKDAGELAGCGRLGVPVSEEWLDSADVVIDFSSPAGLMARLPEAARRGCAVLVGTTGLSDADKAELAHVARHVPVLIAPNMSVGVNLLFRLVGEVAASLGAEYDIEIVEAHHRFKKDAPSGTAMKLAEEIATATGRSLAKDVCYGRHGVSAERKHGEIGVHAVRAGDIVGDHTVTFCALGERIEITHRAHTRDTFVRGAIRAARFLAGKKPGMYAMRDVLSGKC
jgi:4-hydroxy-tetrahydrodipicolinate reductase